MVAVSRVPVNHDGRGGHAPDPWFRIMGEWLSAVGLMSGLTWISLRSWDLRAFCMALGLKFVVVR